MKTITFSVTGTDSGAIFSTSCRRRAQRLFRRYYPNQKIIVVRDHRSKKQFRSFIRRCI